MLGSKVGHAKFVNYSEEVDEENGKILLVPQDELSKFLQSSKTAAIFLTCTAYHSSKSIQRTTVKKCFMIRKV